MNDNRQEHPLYLNVWTTLRQIRFRNRIIAISVGSVLVALCGIGLVLHSGTLAVTGAIGAISIFWLVQCGLLDGDLVGTCLHLMYNRSLTPVELAILDMHSHSRVQVSQIDRSIQRALRLYRSLNHNRLYR